VKITHALRGVQRLGVETSPFIYLLENIPIYADKVQAVFDIVETTHILMCSSAITLTEALMKPIKAGDKALTEAYRQLLTRTNSIQLIAVTPILADKAAHLRAQYNLRTPDALHIATAIEARCDAFLTNDVRLGRVKELRVMVLDELEIDPA
jgi:predicted nucleic acid-binding protein